MRDLLVLARFGARHPRTLLALRWLSTYLAPYVSPPKESHEGDWVAGAPYFRLRSSYLPIPKRLTLKHTRRLAFLHNRSRLSWLAPTFLCLLFLNGKVVEAQSPATVAGEIPVLDIGDEFPYPVLENVLFTESGTLDLSGYRGKLLILDFWATWCAPCVAEIPKTLALNKKYQNDLLILPVTEEGREKVIPLINRLAASKNLEFDTPASVANKSLPRIFPHTLLPHYVWIDRGGKVLAITGQDQVTEKNLLLAMEGKFEARRPVGRQTAYDPDRSVLENQLPETRMASRQQSVLTGHVPGWPSQYRPFKVLGDGTARLVALNLSIQSLFKHAFSYDDFGSMLGNNRVETEDPELVVFLGMDAAGQEKWMSEGGVYVYELTIPLADWDQRFRILQSDLHRLFPMYRAAVEKAVRPVNIMRFREGYGPGQIASEGGRPFVSRSLMEFRLVNGPLKRLPEFLDYFALAGEKRPLVYEFDGDVSADIHLEGNLGNVVSLNRLLAPYGLEIVEGEREIDVLFIRNSPTHPSHHPKHLPK